MMRCRCSEDGRGLLPWPLFLRSGATSEAPEPLLADDSRLAKKLAKRANESKAAAHVLR